MPTKSPVTDQLKAQLHNNPGKATFRMRGMKHKRRWNRRKYLSAMRRAQNG